MSSSARLCQQSGGGVRDDHGLVQFISDGAGGDVVGFSGGSYESLRRFTGADLVAAASGSPLKRPIESFPYPGKACRSYQLHYRTWVE